MIMKRSIIGYLLALTTVTIWSSTFIITKLLLDYLTESQILIFRSFFAVITLFIIYPKITKTNKKEELLYFLSGTALALYFIFENTAVNTTFPSNVGLLVATSPIFTAIIISHLEKKGYFTTYTIIGFVLAQSGVALVVLSDTGIEGFSPLGDILAVLAALMFSVYTVILSSVSKETHIIEKTRKVFIYSFLVFLIYSFLFQEPILWEETTPMLFVGVLYLGVIASSFAFIFWNRAIDIIGTYKTSLFIYLIPVITMIMSILFINEKITVFKLIGASFIIGGLYLSENVKSKV